MKLIYKISIASLLTLPLLAQAESQMYQGLSPSGEVVAIPNPNQQILPNPFPVYVNGQTIINHPVDGFSRVDVPVDNSYTNNPGCYVMCYSHEKGLYSVGNNIYAQGMIRVSGTYQNRICLPTDAGMADISAMQSYKDLCNEKISTCHGDCWAGGDTGGLYGMQ